MKQVVGTFEIPEDLAKRLSELLTKKAIREQVLAQVVSEPSKYDTLEEKLIPVINEIDKIKTKITTEYVPSQYNDERYQWSFNGYEIDGNKLEVYEETE